MSRGTPDYEECIALGLPDMSDVSMQIEWQHTKADQKPLRSVRGRPTTLETYSTRSWGLVAPQTAEDEEFAAAMKLIKRHAAIKRSAAMKLSAIKRTEAMASAGALPVTIFVGSETGIQPKIPEVFRKLSQVRDDSGRADLGQLAHDITSVCKDPSERNSLQMWLIANAKWWVTARRPALAAVIEAGAHLAVPETVDVIAAVLADAKADLQVASVAAQRIRRLGVADSSLRQQIGHNLQNRVDWWLKDPKTKRNALWALPSAALLLWDGDRRWLLARIADSDDEVSCAAAQGVLEVAGAERSAIDAKASDDIFEVSWNRYIRRPNDSPSTGGTPRPALEATLILVLAAVATWKNVEKVARILRDAFEKPARLGAAATVEAGRLLALRWGEKGMSALLAAFVDSHSTNRYLALLVRGK